MNERIRIVMKIGKRKNRKLKEFHFPKNGSSDKSCDFVIMQIEKS